MNKKNIFPISSMSDWNVDDTLVETDRNIVEIINKSLSINSYTKKMSRINLVFMAMDPTTHSFRPDRKFWRWKSGSFDMYVNVPDYEKFCNATHKEAKKIIAKLYLASIKKYLWKRKDFDAPKFYKDVKEVFKPILNS